MSAVAPYPRSLSSASPLLSVCLAVGPSEPIEPVLATIDSVLAQENGDVEVIVKSAGQHLAPALSKHAASAGAAGRMRLIFGQDTGIYDAFNICVASARGRHLMFLGCGDTLAHHQVVDMVAEKSFTAEAGDVLYGPVLLARGSRQTVREFDNRCFFGQRARLPWRNPCHHQGLIYRSTWLAQRPFRTDIGPLADLVHNYQHRVFDIAQWLDRPISIFQQGGASTQVTLKALTRRMRAVLVNCERFRVPVAWKALSFAVLITRYLADRIRPI